MKVEIKYQPTLDEVSVGVYEDEILVYCNHANRRLEKIDNGYADSTIGDWRDNWELCWVCDKCNWAEVV